MASRLTQYRKVAPALVEQREATRHRVRVSRAVVIGSGDRSRLAVLHDLSIFGCRILAPRAYPAGEAIWLAFADSAPVAAKVVWAEDGFMGCRFDTPISRTLLRSLTLAG